MGRCLDHEYSGLPSGNHPASKTTSGASTRSSHHRLATMIRYGAILRAGSGRWSHRHRPTLPFRLTARLCALISRLRSTRPAAIQRAGQPAIVRPHDRPLHPASPKASPLPPRSATPPSPHGPRIRTRSTGPPSANTETGAPPCPFPDSCFLEDESASSLGEGNARSRSCQPRTSAFALFPWDATVAGPGND